MLIDELKEMAREGGVVGAGGAGFPTYAKMTEKADTVILNCTECEPLLKLHIELLYYHADEIIMMLDEVRETLGAKEAVIGIKEEHKKTRKVLGGVLGNYPHVRICTVDAAYPMGDEVILIYEATGRVVKPGGLPIDENVIVYNAETMYNLYQAVHLKKPVSHKLVCITGEIDHPATLWIPIGTYVKDAVAMAGNITCDRPAYIMGGPMMGLLGSERAIITRTTSAIIILPDDHKVVMRMHKDIDIERKRASSACCQCRTCTDLCPRHLLGHPIEPHRVMRAVSDYDTSDLSVYMNTAYCSSCGLCENYSCPQGLSPRTVIAEFKFGIKAAGLRDENPKLSPVDENRDLKKVPVDRLRERLDLGRYDRKAPIVEKLQTVDRVKVLLREHIGAPAIAIVKEGDRVEIGQKIAKAAEGLSVALHASIDGTVEKVTEKEVIINKNL